MEFDVIVDTRQVNKVLDSLRTKLLNWSDGMEAVGSAFKQYYATKPFASRGSVFGSVWPDLQPAYASYKARKFPGRPILVATGAMAQGFDFTANSDQVKVFNPVDYFEKHQKGESVPQRTSMALNSELKQMAQDILQKDLQAKMRGLGL